MTPQEQEEFYIDPKTFSWVDGTNLYGYGVEKYLFKTDVVHPDGKTLLVLKKNHLRYFEDVKTAFLDFPVLTKKENIV